jgi:hypothetical protein
MSEQNLYSATEQPDPVQNEKPAVWELVQEDFKRNYSSDPVTNAVLDDMKARDDWGRTKYKTPLQPFNGRDALIDFYQELLDGAVYSRQYLFERGGEQFFFDQENSDLLDVYDNLLFAIRAIRARIFQRDGK